MLSIQGLSHRYCDGVSRRNFLQIGGLALGGLSLPQLLQAEAQTDAKQSHKSIIMVFLSGGPPHQDMVDLKPDAPSEIRGEFKSIATKVSGIRICEHLPRVARMTDRLAIIRSLVGSEGHHSAFQCMHGRTQQKQPGGGWPSLGSTVSKLQGQTTPGVLPFVGLSPKMITRTWANVGEPGFLGPAHAAFKPNADGMGGLVLKGKLDDLKQRRQLLRSFDNLRRDVDASGALSGADEYTKQALSILTSSKLAEALDLDREPSRVRDWYGRGDPEPAGYGDAGPLMNDYLLAARRLVEAGVRVVTLGYGRWDWHGKPHGTTFENARHHLPILDQGLCAPLLEDLRVRGLDKDVTVLVWGEFGRTPRINKMGGRDHWPQVGCALMAGGGMKTGQVIGSTDAQAGLAKDRPVHFQEVFATLYHNLGLDPRTRTVADLTGRPHYLVDDPYGPIKELV